MLTSFVHYLAFLLFIYLITSVFQLTIDEKKELSHFIMKTSRYHTREKAYLR